MTRDSSATYIHLHSSRLADVFEEFCRPPSSTVTVPSNTNASGAGGHQQQQTNGAAGGGGGAGNTAGDGSGITSLPGHFLPFEEIALPPHLMPLNPEDEDDVVPDMHAAFGINRALGQNQSTHGTATGGGGGAGGGEASTAGVQREPVWRDLGLESLMSDLRTDAAGDRAAGARREGRRTGVLLLR